VVIGDKVGNGRCKEVDEMDEMDAMEESLRRSEEETMRRVEKEREKGKCGIDVSDDFGVVGEAVQMKLSIRFVKASIVTINSK
jgi:hypothetical protein